MIPLLAPSISLPELMNGICVWRVGELKCWPQFRTWHWITKSAQNHLQSSGHVDATTTAAATIVTNATTNNTAVTLSRSCICVYVLCATSSLFADCMLTSCQLLISFMRRCCWWSPILLVLGWWWMKVKPIACSSWCAVRKTHDVINEAMRANFTSGRLTFVDQSISACGVCVFGSVWAGLYINAPVWVQMLPRA